MPSTFFGLNIASSGLSAFQTAVNTTANNISNVQTNGYSRQVANRQASLGIRVHQKYGTAGSGVTTNSITSMRDSYYDVRYWDNQSNLGLYDTKLYYLNQVEDYFADDDDDGQGFSSIFDKMFNLMDTLSAGASDSTKRGNFISQAQILTNYFRQVSTGLQAIQKDTNNQIKTLVDSVNSSASKIAALNKQINIIEIQGGVANELRDQRALIIDELSQIVPVTVSETKITNSNDPEMQLGGNDFVVKIDGQTLVDGYNYNSLQCVARENKVYQTDAKGMYDIQWSNSKMNFNVTAPSMDGSLKALFEVRDGNNKNNFQGVVTGTSNRSVTIKPSTMTSVETMSMAEEGYVTINNKQYKYTGFSAVVDDAGKVTSYTFQLEKSLDADESTTLMGKNSKIGETIDSMGIPYYMTQVSEFLRNFMERFNAYQQSGVTLDNKQMGSFFVADAYDGHEYDFSDQKVDIDGVTTGSASIITSTSNSYYQLTGFNIAVADESLRDSSRFSTTASTTTPDASEILDAMMKLQSEVKLFRGGSAQDFLACMYTDITVDTEETRIFCTNYSDIQATITNQRLSVSGVDEDEEALDLVKFQNAYNLASRMIQTMSEMYDRLITQTGV